MKANYWPLYALGLLTALILVYSITRIFAEPGHVTLEERSIITESSDHRQCTIYVKQIESQNLEVKANLVDWVLRNCDEVKFDRISTDTIPKMIEYRMSH